MTTAIFPCYLSKVFERYPNNLLYNLKSEFRKHCSTEAALINIIDRVLINLGNNCINGSIFADFKKAFDPVDVSALIGKLRLYDDACSLQLVKSYLYRAKEATYL